MIGTLCGATNWLLGHWHLMGEQGALCGLLATGILSLACVDFPVGYMIDDYGPVFFTEFRNELSFFPSRPDFFLFTIIQARRWTTKLGDNLYNGFSSNDCNFLPNYPRENNYSLFDSY